MGRRSNFTGWATLASISFTIAWFLLGNTIRGASQLTDVRLNADAADLITVHGNVLDVGGKPVAGAHVMAVGDAWTFDKPIAQTRSEQDGSFTISFRKSFFDFVFTPWENTAIAATVTGFPPQWKRWNEVDESGQMVLRLLADDMPIEGRIVDLEGKSVKGARLVVHHTDPAAPDLKSLSLAGTDDSGPFGWRVFLPGFALGLGPITTDADGRFLVRGIGANRTVSFILHGPGLAYSTFEVQTRRGPIQRRSFQPDVAAHASNTIVYGATFDYAAAPGRVVMGTVRDATTHLPLAGITIKPDVNRRKTVTTITDNNGRYRLEGIAKEKGTKVTAVPNDAQPYVMRDNDVPDTPGFGPITVDFELHRGVWISGKVTDKVTGQPVFTRINYLPYLTNPHALALPEFQQDPIKRIPGEESRCYTKPDGTYRMVGLPGKALIAAWFTVKRPYLRGVGADKVKCPRYRGAQYSCYRPILAPDMANAIGEVDIPEGVEDSNLDFQLDPGISIRIHITDPAGNPLAGVAVSPAPNGYNLANRANTYFDALALKPTDKYVYFFRDDARKLGKALEIRPDQLPARQTSVKLEPLAIVTGRLIDKDGQPLADARLDADGPCNCGTDAEGKFKLILLPGREYHIFGIKGRTFFDTDAKKIPSVPGNTHDIGDVHMKPYM